MSGKSNRRDDIYDKNHKRYDRVKHSRKLKFEAKAKLDAGKITKRQYALLMNEAEKVLTGYFEDTSSYTKTTNKAQLVQTIVRDGAKSILSTDINQRQLSLGEREKLSNKRMEAKLAIQLFREDYPNCKLSQQVESVQQQYLRRAKYQLYNTAGVQRVTERNPNSVKPLPTKKAKEYSVKVKVEVSTPEPEKISTPVPKARNKKSLAPKIQTTNVQVAAEKLYLAQNPQGNFAQLTDSERMSYYKAALK